MLLSPMIFDKHEMQDCLVDIFVFFYKNRLLRTWCL